MLIEDQKEKYRELKNHTQEVEKAAQEQHRQRKNFQKLYEQA